MGKPILQYKKSELYDRVVDEYDVFGSSYEFMVFLAVLGYREGNAKRSDYTGNRDNGTKGEIALQNLYSNEFIRVVMSSLAFQDTGKPEALVDQKTQMTTLAQFAAGGLEIAEQAFGDTAGDPTDAILNHVKTHHEPAEYQGTLGEIVDAFDEQLLDGSGQE
jgi:hypothetical protein